MLDQFSLDRQRHLAPEAVRRDMDMDVGNCVPVGRKGVPTH